MSDSSTAAPLSPHPRSKYHPATMIRGLYDWVIHWADTKYASPALFGISFAESSLFPIPPDVLLIAMGVSNPKKALRYAFICLIGSVLGGVLGYFIGMKAWTLVDHIFYSYVPGFTEAKFQMVTDLYHQHSWLILFTAAFTPIPFKIFTIAGGVVQLPISEFVLASVVGRGLRFFLVGGTLRFFGTTMKVYIEKYFDLLAIVFTVMLIAGFFLLKIVMH